MTEFSPPQRTSYPVSGATLRDVADAVSHLPEAGKVIWAPQYSLESDGSGVVTRAAVRCSFEVQMPVWTAYRSASAAAREEWDRWWMALEAHEQGHVEIATGAFDGIEQQMVGQSVATAEAVFRAAEARAQAESDAYDSSTSHGISSGTVLDTSIG
jgi:predicted secreted Zn-dependent protease